VPPEPDAPPEVDAPPELVGPAVVLGAPPVGEDWRGGIWPEAAKELAALGR
jgi:hypothetical protein